MPTLFDFPQAYTRAERAAVGSIDDLRWFTGEHTGPATADVPARAPLYVRGWMLHCDARSGAPSVIVRVDGARTYEARAGTPRPDVAGALGEPEAERSGFEAIVPTGLLAPGLHELTFYSLDPASGRYAELEARSTFYLLPSDRSFPAALPHSDTGCEARIDEIRDLSHQRELEAAAAELTRGSLLYLRGWAYDAAAAGPAAAVFALVDGRTAFAGDYRLDRPDVAAAHGSDDLSAVGYTVQIPTIELDLGRHAVEIVALAADGDRLLRSGCRLDVGIREPAGLGPGVFETTPAFLDSVVRVAGSRERERITPMRAERGDELFIRGWAIDGSAGAVGAGVVLVVDDNAEFSALYGLPRPDIAEAFGNPRLVKCGFTAQIPTAGLALGRHWAKCYVIAADGRGTLSTAQEFAFEVADSRAEVLTRT